MAGIEKMGKKRGRGEELEKSRGTAVEESTKPESGRGESREEKGENAGDRLKEKENAKEKPERESEGVV